MLKFHPFFLLSVTCVACGASFSASDGAGGSGAGTAGEASGGLASSAGEGQTAGWDGSGAGRTGWGNGGRGSGLGGGNWGSSECTTIRQEFQAAVDQARVCDSAATNQCSPSSFVQPLGCGCPVFLNAKSEYADTAKKAYQAYQDARCDYGGATCNVYCAPVSSVGCEQQSTSSGSSFLCAEGATQR